MEYIMGLTVGQILGRSVGVLAILSVFIEIIPIKFNPISMILSWIGKRTNSELAAEFKSFSDKQKEVNEKIGLLNTKVDGVNDRIDLEHAENCKSKILRFADEIGQGAKHSQEHFNQILTDIDEYEDYCDSHHDYQNTKTVIATARIKEVYAKGSKNNDFL
jgi:hypothetical protein